MVNQSRVEPVGGWCGGPGEDGPAPGGRAVAAVEAK